MPRNACELHLFSTPGVDGMEWVVKACQPYLEKKAGATLVYLPLAALYLGRAEEETQAAFDGLARVLTVNTETMELPEMEAMLRGADAVYIPGGNTYLLNHRLHVSHLFESLQRKLQAGLPMIGASAGAVVCGPNILTSNDLNMVSTQHFAGLHLIPFNFSVHYPDTPEKDAWLNDYRWFHDNPLLLLEDGAYLRVHGKSCALVRGDAWIWRPGQEKERLEAGEVVSRYKEATNG